MKLPLSLFTFALSLFTLASLPSCTAIEENDHPPRVYVGGVLPDDPDLNAAGLSLETLVGEGDGVPVSKSQIPASCVAIDANRLDPPGPIGVLRMWAHPSKVWKASDMPLRVRFVGGSATQQKKVWSRFQQIDGICGADFIQVTSGPSDIRVGFVESGMLSGHWSYLGTDATRQPANAQTMNIQLSRWDGTAEYDRVALHEICHALGCPHEHQHPRGGIPWNVPAVLQEYRRTQGWSDAQIRRQVLNRYTGNDFLGTEFRPDSIMCYPIDARLTTNGFSVGWNRKLSLEDIAFLQKLYPQPAPPRAPVVISP